MMLGPARAALLSPAGVRPISLKARARGHARARLTGTGATADSPEGPRGAPGRTPGRLRPDTAPPRRRAPSERGADRRERAGGGEEADGRRLGGQPDRATACHS